LEAKEMTVLQYGSEEWVLRKGEEDLLDVFKREKNYIEDRYSSS
jgi:hypothetical protein